MAIKARSTRNSEIPKQLTKKMREEMNSDPFMQLCIHEGVKTDDIEFEHSFKYINQRIHERWAVVPVRRKYNRDAHGYNKWYNQIVALYRFVLASSEYQHKMRSRYPKFNFEKRLEELCGKEEKFEHFAGNFPAIWARLLKYRISG